MSKLVPMAKGDILSDGSREGMTFSQKKFENTSPNIGGETYGDYYNRIKKLQVEGFDIGDLSFADYRAYCYGGGQAGVDPDLIVGSEQDNTSDDYED